MNDSTSRAPLQFADAVRIAKGCTDYGGGYRVDAALSEAYQSGIATVINALQAAQRSGMADSQVRALHGIGGDPEKVRAAAPLLLDALQRVVAMWDHHTDVHGDGVASPLHEAARAAIAAATN